MTKVVSPPPGDSPDETRLTPDETQPSPPRRDASHPSSGWLASSGAIDHGRFPPGTILGGRYRIVGRLGRGGMGEVFRADDLKLGQPVALKFLPPDVDRDPAKLTQLHTEVRMARQVSHPNVCRVYDIDEVEGHTFLSMEYVDGEDLASLLRRIGRFSEERGLEIARQICAGLAAAHERGVVHRDFKPANVMVDGTGRARITDFGLAGASGEAIRAGTPAYMAPEQLAGGEVTARSDIYALGLVLYELFTGKRALEGNNLADLIRRREQSGITPPADVVRDLNPDIDRVIMRCVAPQPERRPASALSVSAALPGGDPLAAALAAGETPSPEMVAAAGESGALARGPGIALLSFVLVGLVVLAVISDRTLLVNRITFPKKADVLEERAREIIALAGYRDPPADTARGVNLSSDYVSWLAAQGAPGDRYASLADPQAPLLGFWYRTSPRALVQTATSWTPQINDPPLDVSGMVTVAVDERGRLIDFVAMPPQRDTSSAAATPFDWKPFFTAAGLPFDSFTPTAPQWTPRIYATERLAWEGPMPGSTTGATRRVEAASYGGRPVSFKIVWPWTRPVRMEEPLPSARVRVLSLIGTVFVLGLLVGALLLVRHNLRSGRADRRGASRIALVLTGFWVVSWILGARHFLSVDNEADRFFSFLAFALLNSGFTWLLYLALEPFVRRLCPDMLIGWSRLLAGQWRDPLVGRDLLIGTAAGLFFALAASAFPLIVAQIRGSDVPLQNSTVSHLLGVRYGLSVLVRLFPNTLQTAMLSTFAYVMLLALVRRGVVAIGLILLLFVGVILAESGEDPMWVTVLFAAVIVGPALFVFQRYGVLALATALFVNQATRVVPLTADLVKPHAPAAALTVLLVCAAAVYAFRISRAGDGLLRRFLPSA